MDERSRALFEKDFVAAAQQQQTALLTQARPTKEQRAKRKRRPASTFFRAIKSMTITGYYTTEIGLRQELGDDGQLFLAVSQGCDHPEHQG